MKKLVYILVASVFLGAQILAIDVGIAKVSMYRLFLGINIAVLGYLLYQNHPAFSLSFNYKKNQFRWIYFFWLFTAVLSILWAEDTISWLKGLFFVGCGITSIMLISYFLKTEKEIKYLFIIVFSMIGLHQMIGWYEIMTNHYMWAGLSDATLSKFAKNPLMRTPYSIYANINDYSTLIFASIPFAFILLRNTKRLWLKIVSVLSLFSTILLLLQTGSRANQLAVIVFVLTVLIAKYMNRKIFKYSVYFTCLLIVLSIASYLLVPSIRYAAYDLIQSFTSGTGSNIYRVNMILNGFIYLSKSFGLGVGSGNIEYWMVEDPLFTVDAPNIHNWFMDILVGYGVGTFILYCVMYIYILRQLYVSYKYSHNLFIQSSSLYLFAYVTGFIFSSMSSATNIIIEWQWVVWGVLIAYVQFTENRDREFILSSNKQFVL